MGQENKTGSGVQEIKDHATPKHTQKLGQGRASKRSGVCRGLGWLAEEQGQARGPRAETGQATQVMPLTGVGGWFIISRVVGAILAWSKQCHGHNCAGKRAWSRCVEEGTPGGHERVREASGEWGQRGRGPRGGQT